MITLNEKRDIYLLLPDDNAWAVDASEIRQHIKEEYAGCSMHVFKVLGVPVFYSLSAITDW